MREVGPETKKFMRKAHMVRLGVMPFYIAVYELLFVIPRYGLALFIVQIAIGAICLIATALIDKLVMRLTHGRGFACYPEWAESDARLEERLGETPVKADGDERK